MAELLATLVGLGAQVLQKQSPGEEQNICMALLPPLLGAAVIGVRALAVRFKALQAP